MMGYSEVACRNQMTTKSLYKKVARTKQLRTLKGWQQTASLLGHPIDVLLSHADHTETTYKTGCIHFQLQTVARTSRILLAETSLSRIPSTSRRPV